MKQTNIYSHKGWLKDITIREYPYSSAGEIAARHGVCSGSVWYWVKKLGLQQTDETKARILKKTRGCIANTIKTNPEAKRKSMETKKRTWMMERFRVMSGLPQQTKMRIATRPTKVYKAIWYLENMRNYFRDIEVGGKFTLYYDDETLRQGVLLRTTTWTRIQKSIVFCTLLYFLLKNELLKDNSRVRTPIFDFTWLLRRLRSSNEVVV